jgi:Mrp family chromosome partitioning ATPase
MKTFMVLSGKGGVGKSTVSSNLALSLSLRGYKVGILDIDIHGPSIPTIFNLEDKQVFSTGGSIFPVEYTKNLQIMSIGFLTENKNNALIWRGPMKMKILQQFTETVVWGDIDYMIIDCPPGTGDELISIKQLLKDIDGGIIVSTSSKLSIIDAYKGINFCKEIDIPITGVIENMSGFICPKCNNNIDVFHKNNVLEMTKKENIAFLGKIPLDSQITDSIETGKPFLEKYKDSETAKIIEDIVDKIIKE